MIVSLVERLCDNCLKNKKIVLFDTNIWIDFADQKTELARQCKSLCLSLSKNNLCAFPLSFASIQEVFEHPKEEQAILQARLMDELSGGICFRLIREIEEKEIELGFQTFFLKENKTHDHSYAFTFTFNYLGDLISSIIQKYGLPVSEKDIEHWRMKFNIEYFLQHLGEVRKFCEDSKQNYVDKMKEVRTKSIEDYTKNGRFNHHKYLSDGRVTVYDKDCKYRLVKMAQDRLTNRIKNEEIRDKSGIDEYIEKKIKPIMTLSHQDKELFVKSLPSAELLQELMTERVRNIGRKIQKQDLCDNEMSRYIPYTHIFVSNDGNLIDVLSRCPIVRQRKIVLCKGIENFMATITNPLICSNFHK